MSPKHETEFADADVNSGEWYKSSYSVSNSHCVEAIGLPAGRLAVRDSKNIGPVLTFGANEWHSFISGIKLGQFEK